MDNNIDIDIDIDKNIDIDNNIDIDENIDIDSIKSHGRMTLITFIITFLIFSFFPFSSSF